MPHVHSFAVDAACDCGIMLYALVRSIKHQNDKLIAAAKNLLKNYDMITAEEETRFCDDRLVIEFEDLRAVLAKAEGHQ